MRKIISLLLVICLGLSITMFTGCSSTPKDSSNGGNTPEKQIPDLMGEWKQSNSKSEDSYQAATISSNTIEIYWISDNGNTKSLYWAGSFVAPTTTDEPYNWNSENDHSKTGSAMLASSADTKTMTYQRDVLSYEASAMGTTTTVKLEKQSNTSESSIENTSQPTVKGESKVEIASERVMKFTSSIGSSEAIYVAEIKNVGTETVKLDDISIDLEDNNGQILNTVTYVSAYPNVINVGETAYICESLLDVASDVNLDDVGNAILHYDIKGKDEINPLNVEITETKLTVEYNSPKLVGRIENKSDTELKQIYVACPVYNKDSELVTVIFTIIDNLKPGEKQGFDQMAIFCDTTIDYSECTFKTIAYEYVMF